MVELKQFIKEALLNIVEGVEEANSVKNRFKILGVRHDTGIDGNYVDFDVTVFANASTSKGASGKAEGTILNVVSAGIDGKIDQTKMAENTHNLKFKIYIKEE